jgi:hypothetical protein
MNVSTTGLSLTADAAVDLQLHTIHSDGAWTPAVLLDYLAQARCLPVLVAVKMTAAWLADQRRV